MTPPRRYLGTRVSSSVVDDATLIVSDSPAGQLRYSPSARSAAATSDVAPEIASETTTVIGAIADRACDGPLRTQEARGRMGKEMRPGRRSLDQVCRQVIRSHVARRRRRGPSVQYNTPSAAASAASPRKNLQPRGGRIQEVRRAHERRALSTHLCFAHVA